MSNAPIRTCNDSRIVRSEIIVHRHLNDKDTYYGGEIMAHFDSASGGAVYKFLRKPSFTATIDSLNFVSPIHKNEQIYVEAYVSGVGKSSVEVFTKLVATDLKTFKKRIASYAFLTFVIQDREDPDFVMPVLVPETEEEKAICKEYPKRRAMNLEKRKLNQQMETSIQLDPIWEQLAK